MEFWQALYELGVRDDTLTITEKEKLDRDGYLPLEGIYTREQAARILDTRTSGADTRGKRAVVGARTNGPRGRADHSREHAEQVQVGRVRRLFDSSARVGCGGPCVSSGVLFDGSPRIRSPLAARR